MKHKDLDARASAELARVHLEELEEIASAFARASLSENTRLAYASTWRAWSEWCAEKGLEALPAKSSSVALWITYLATEGLKPSSIDRHLAAIATRHRLEGHKNPTSSAHLALVRTGMRKSVGTAKKQKQPVSVATLKKFVGTLPSNVRGTRDRAILVLGWHAALRRAEIVAINIDDLHFDDEGLTLTVRRSKRDGEGAGERVGVPYGSSSSTCPVRAVRAWLEARGNPSSGPLFTSCEGRGRIRISSARLDDEHVATLVIRCAKLLELPVGHYSGHSLRAGLITSAAKAGKPLQSIMKQSRHKTLAVLLEYVRDADLFSDNAAAGLGT